MNVMNVYIFCSRLIGECVSILNSVLMFFFLVEFQPELVNILGLQSNFTTGIMKHSPEKQYVGENGAL